MERDLFFGSERRYRIFTAVKYIVYLLLAFNIYLFLQEELQALEHTFVDGFALGQLIQVFSSTIDTAAWVILLLLFEMETSLLDDRHIKGRVKWTLHGVRGICYIAIVYALTGYVAELQMLYQAVVLPLGYACTVLDAGYSILLQLDEYATLDAAYCANMGAETYQLSGFNIVVDAKTLQDARWLAWTDVVNSATWIFVCLVLEIEVRLALRGELSDRVMATNKFVKIMLYAILFAAAFYWGIAGDFLDFWDAALWLFAFMFIELNVFEWQFETKNPSTA